jgi:hypothetical protein
MSRFKKVSEIENIPSFLEKKFVGAQVEVEEDPYAELRMNSAENRMKISKQNIGFTKEANSFSKSWEKISGPSLYNDLRQETVEDRLLAQDFSAIKRSGSFYDDGESARTTTSGLKAYSSEEYMDCMLRGSSNIFNPDMISISKEFLNSQESTTEQAVVEQQRLREAKASRHQSWEEKNINKIKKANVVNSRAHSILRTSSDNEFNSTFGMIDPESLDQRESMRIANQDRVRNERLSIQKNFQDQMIEKSKNRAQTVSDIYNNIDLDLR